MTSCFATPLTSFHTPMNFLRSAPDGAACLHGSRLKSGRQVRSTMHLWLHHDISHLAKLVARTFYSCIETVLMRCRTKVKFSRLRIQHREDSRCGSLKAPRWWFGIPMLRKLSTTLSPLQQSRRWKVVLLRFGDQIYDRGRECVHVRLSLLQEIGPRRSLFRVSGLTPTLINLDGG